MSVTVDLGWPVVADRFSGVFGDLRGRAGADDLFLMPACPEGGHCELVAVDMRREHGSDWWVVGWYGSAMTFSLHCDSDRQALWQRHRRLSRGADGKVLVELLTLDRSDPYPHLRRSWASLPDELKARICHEVKLGVHPLSGSSNERPLRPF